jgi:small subunit ribosomal protein S6
MAKPAPEYELVLMLDPEATDERRDEIAVEARRRIESGGGLKQERSWGLRKMAYEINRRTEADYRFFRFDQGGSVLEELNHNLKITDGVLRFRIFKVDPGAPVIDPPPPISLAATAAPPRGGRRRDDDRPPRGPGPAQAEAPAPAAEVPAAAETPAPAEEPAPAETPAPAAPEAPAEAEPEAQAAEAPADEPAEGAPAEEQT